MRFSQTVPYQKLDLFTDTDFRAELDIRTGRGRYKKAMFYRYRKGYGNDLARQPMDDKWREACVVEMEEFFGHLFRI